MKEVLSKKIKACASCCECNTVAEFCKKKLGICECFLSLIIHEKRKPSIKTIKKLVKCTENFGEYAIKIEDIL